MAFKVSLFNISYKFHVIRVVLQLLLSLLLSYPCEARERAKEEQRDNLSENTRGNSLDLIACPAYSDVTMYRQPRNASPVPSCLLLVLPASKVLFTPESDLC
jgi:hypothetical protein